MNNEFAIFPPYEAFYIESMLLSSSSAIELIETLVEIFTNKEVADDYTNDDILNYLQTIIIHAAALSRYFWPTRNRDNKLHKIHQKRASHLRQSFEITENSALKNRDLRNQIEHFDENLDVFCTKILVGMIYPKHVGPTPPETGVATHVFKAFYTDVGVFEVLGNKFEVKPIFDELYRIHEKLIEFSSNGYRMNMNIGNQT